MGCGILCCKHRAEGEAPAGLGLVGDDYAVGIALVADGVDAGDFVVAVAVDLQGLAGSGSLETLDLAEGSEFVNPTVLAGELGELKAGMLADIAVLDRNLCAIPSSQIQDTKVLLTILDGEIVYEG